MMKNLINNITIQNGLQIIPIDNNIDFAYYESKDDFFIFLFCTYSQLIELNNGEMKNIEYALNAMIVDLKEKDILKQFKERYIDYNLSFILVLEVDYEDINILHELNKIQENNKNAKKYILPYNKKDLNSLEQKISDETPIIQELNRISIENSELLKNNEEGWYKLLITLFIKIPFLNYLSDKRELKLGNLSETIISKLSENEKKILSILKVSDFDKYSNIEDFVSEHKLRDYNADEI
ncbi:hypothetical protein [Dysgonomonas capnocytophagoides]|uniref:hypothetical protein n=1 Tax=Dysgonomonas capnocytophagoides TaxID=45254 RepID=UPI0033422625